MSLPIWDPRKLLESPQVYNLFQRFVGGNKGRQVFIAKYILPRKPNRVLEVGCGPGTNCRSFPDGTAYVGCDCDNGYIAYAKKQFGKRAEFYAVPVGQLRQLGVPPFDMIIALSVLHHLNDEEVLTLSDEVHDLLKPGGLFITADPCFMTGQSKLERFITSCDRGKFVRFPEDCMKLLGKRFPRVTWETMRSRLPRIPCTGVIMIAENAPNGARQP
jgi:SAM-dependent methyltransferase